VFDNPFDHDNVMHMNVFGKHGGSVVGPIQVVGTILLFTTCIPMADELAVLPHFYLTLPDEWNPHTILLSSLSGVEEVPSSVANIYDGVEDVSLLRVNDVVNDVVHCLYPKSDLSTCLSTCLLSQVRLYSHSIDLLKTWSFQADDWHLAKAVNELSNLWDIGHEANSVLPLTDKFCTVVKFGE
jgi:hypothetical protein